MSKALPKNEVEIMKRMLMLMMLFMCLIISTPNKSQVPIYYRIEYLTI